MGLLGGVDLSEHLEQLKRDLREYYGAINEVKMGLRREMPPRPAALVQYEQCQALNLPLVSGGVKSQPYIWLQEVAVIIEEAQLFELLEKRQAEMSSSP